MSNEIDQRIRSMLHYALIVCRDPHFAIWADNWLSGVNKSRTAAQIMELRAGSDAREAWRSLAQMCADEDRSARMMIWQKALAAEAAEWVAWATQQALKPVLLTWLNGTDRAKLISCAVAKIAKAEAACLDSTR